MLVVSALDKVVGETPTDHLVKGETHKITFDDLVAKVNAFEAAFESHIHGSANGNTTAPIDNSTNPATYANSCLLFPPTPVPTPQFLACTALGVAAPGGPTHIPDPTLAAAVSAATSVPVVPPPPAAGVTRANPMPAADLSTVAKTE